MFFLKISFMDLDSFSHLNLKYLQAINICFYQNFKESKFIPAFIHIQPTLQTSYRKNKCKITSCLWTAYGDMSYRCMCNRKKIF